MSYDTILETRRPEALTRTRLVRDRETGLPLIIREQDFQPIIDDNARQATRYDRHELRQQNVNGFGVQVAHIPIMQFFELHRRGITKSPARFRAWLNRRDARKFRTDDGRKL